MKIWAALAGVFFAAQLCLSAHFALDATANAQNGQAFVTQAGAVAATKDHELAFGENWDSVRTFRLVRTLNAPLKVYIETKPRNASLYKAHYHQYILQALDSWASALDGRLSYVLTNDKKSADITFDWVPTFEDRYVAGITTYSIGHADVEIKTVGIPDKDIKCNIIHEMGHALGIAGHSNASGDIMVGVRRWHRNDSNYDPKLSNRDIQAIRHLYSTAWKQGEDLYAVSAQAVPAPVAVRMAEAKSQQSITTSDQLALETPITVKKPASNNSLAPYKQIINANHR
jgi:hypothetical protein